VGKTVIDLQILGCELHQNVFGGRVPPGPAGGAIVLTAALDPLAVNRGRKGWMGRGRATAPAWKNSYGRS